MVMSSMIPIQREKTLYLGMYLIVGKAEALFVVVDDLCNRHLGIGGGYQSCTY